MVNWLGLWTLYAREVRRFMNNKVQLIAAPIVTTLLFLAVFDLALGQAVKTVNGVAFLTFLIPGLLIMSMMQQAFTNISVSLVGTKIVGSIQDLLMAPISPGESVIGLILSGMTLGVMVGLVTALAIYFFADYQVIHLAYVIYYGISASLMLALLGLVSGLWSDRLENMAVMNRFVIVPLSFLSGTFYPVSRLQEPFYSLAFLNPFFYLIDGFRYGFIGVAETNLQLGIIVTFVINAALYLLAWWLVARGYKLKT